ncbi:MAG: iron chelate uptake ABC transporter family permease subunit [Planctomycetota bacterium]
MKHTIAVWVALPAMLFACQDQALASPADAAATRIITFSPAITDIAFKIGLGDAVVGVTDFCTLPEGEQRPRLGNALNFSSEQLLSVDPDIIMTQSPPGRFEGVRNIAPEVRVEQIVIERLADVPEAAERMARLTGVPQAAEPHARRFQGKLRAVREKVSHLPRRRVLFVMGTDRPNVAGAENFIGDIVEVAGGVNAGADIPGRQRWLQTHIEHIAAARPDVIVCQVSPSEAEKAREYWLQWREIPAAENQRVFVVTDRTWSIPNLDLADKAERLAEMIHPELGGEESAAYAGRTLRIWQARLIRLLAAAVVGAALAAGGAALQGLLRNPLAEPYILGISSGAGVGVLLGLAAGAAGTLPQWIGTPALAFLAAMVTCAVVYGVAQHRGRLDAYSLILSGVIVNAFNGAMMLTVFLYVEPYVIADYVSWAMGSIPDVVGRDLLIACSVCVAVGWIILLMRSAALNTLGLGDDVAVSSGVAVQRLRVEVFVCVGLMTAAAVSLAGPIGFLGLIVPHICRLLIGPDHRRLIVVSGIAGALLLVAAETLCRSAGPLVGVSRIPVGVLTALSGGPFFIVLLRRRFKGGRL